MTGPEGAEGKLAAVVRAQGPLGTHAVEVPRADDRPARRAVLTLRVAAVQVPPPKNAPRRAQLPAVPVWVVEAVEERPPGASGQAMQERDPKGRMGQYGDAGDGPLIKK